LARTDFRAAAARRLSEERELSPAIFSLLSEEQTTRSVGVRIVPLDRIEPNPEQPRLAFNEETLLELSASIREHGVLQPILVRPLEGNRFQLIAGERRWRASKLAGVDSIPALIEDIDDDTALEISIIENLQREDISPLDEAAMYDRMVRDHGYSIRKLADKLGKDKGYVENRLRLADAPDDVREMLSVRKDTISHAYELMKIGEERKRRRLEKRILAGDLTLAKLRLITGTRPEPDEAPAAGRAPRRRGRTVAGEVAAIRAADDAFMGARTKMTEGMDDMIEVLRQPELMEQIPSVNRDNFVKHLTITKLKIENAIAIIRAGTPATDEVQ
jgi:ParB family chromosome partitioning protein